jgi:hypothetical protein
MPDDAYLAKLTTTFSVAGSRYIALSLAGALRETQTVTGLTAGELAQIAGAKTEWDAAERALTAYQSSKL